MSQDSDDYIPTSGKRSRKNGGHPEEKTPAPISNVFSSSFTYGLAESKKNQLHPSQPQVQLKKPSKLQVSHQQPRPQPQLQPQLLSAPVHNNKENDGPGSYFEFIKQNGGKPVSIRKPKKVLETPGKIGRDGFHYSPPDTQPSLSTETGTTSTASYGSSSSIKLSSTETKTTMEVPGKDPPTTIGNKDVEILSGCTQEIIEKFRKVCKEYTTNVVLAYHRRILESWNDDPKNISAEDSAKAVLIVLDLFDECEPTNVKKFLKLCKETNGSNDDAFWFLHDTIDDGKKTTADALQETIKHFAELPKNVLPATGTATLMDPTAMAKVGTTSAPNITHLSSMETETPEEEYFPFEISQTEYEWMVEGMVEAKLQDAWLQLLWLSCQMYGTAIVAQYYEEQKDMIQDQASVDAGDAAVMKQVVVQSLEATLELLRCPVDLVEKFIEMCEKHTFDAVFRKVQHCASVWEARNSSKDADTSLEDALKEALTEPFVHVGPDSVFAPFLEDKGSPPSLAQSKNDDSGSVASAVTKRVENLKKAQPTIEAASAANNPPAMQGSTENDESVKKSSEMNGIEGDSNVKKPPMMEGSTEEPASFKEASVKNHHTMQGLTEKPPSEGSMEKSEENAMVAYSKPATAQDPPVYIVPSSKEFRAEPPYGLENCETLAVLKEKLLRLDYNGKAPRSFPLSLGAIETDIKATAIYQARKGTDGESQAKAFAVKLHLDCTAPDKAFMLSKESFKKKLQQGEIVVRKKDGGEIDVMYNSMDQTYEVMTPPHELELLRGRPGKQQVQLPVDYQYHELMVVAETEKMKGFLTAYSLEILGSQLRKKGVNVLASGSMLQILMSEKPPMSNTGKHLVGPPKLQNNAVEIDGGASTDDDDPMPEIEGGSGNNTNQLARPFDPTIVQFRMNNGGTILPGDTALVAQANAFGKQVDLEKQKLVVNEREAAAKRLEEANARLQQVQEARFGDLKDQNSETQRKLQETQRELAAIKQRNAELQGQQNATEGAFTENLASRITTGVSNRVVPAVHESVRKTLGNPRNLHDNVSDMGHLANDVESPLRPHTPSAVTADGCKTPGQVRKTLFAYSGKDMSLATEPKSPTVGASDEKKEMPAKSEALLADKKQETENGTEADEDVFVKVTQDIAMVLKAGFKVRYKGSLYTLKEIRSKKMPSDKKKVLWYISNSEHETHCQAGSLEVSISSLNKTG